MLCVAAFVGCWIFLISPVGRITFVDFDEFLSPCGFDKVQETWFPIKKAEQNPEFKILI
jgi:hypothetical protein